MRVAWDDQRWIKNAAGDAVTVWTYKPEDGERIDEHSLFSGIGPGNVSQFAYAIQEQGHAIMSVSWDKPWHHHVVGCGVGHDDAEFAESGRSMAAYYESGDGWGGPWWTAGGSGRDYYVREAA